MVALALLALVSLAAGLGAPDCTGSPNTHPIWTQPPVFVSSVPNGALYLSGNATHNISVVHIYGTPYQMGLVILASFKDPYFRYAHGSLLKSDIAALYTAFFAYFAAEIDSEIKFLPKPIRDVIETQGSPFSLG
jgi:isopenicillin-N N-acyltransferase-like protein